MPAQKHLYGPEVVISFHTSRPYTDTNETAPIFWCGVCHMKLNHVLAALQHLGGKNHKRMLDDNNAPPGEQNASKRKSSPEPGEAPPLKKMKEPKVTDADFRCEDCSLEFGSAITTIQHIKGKKHLKKIVSNTSSIPEDIQRLINSKVEELTKKLKTKEPNVTDSDFRCEDCGEEFSSAVTTAYHIIQHITGKNHMKKLVSNISSMPEHIQKLVDSKVEELMKKLKAECEVNEEEMDV